MKTTRAGSRGRGAAGRRAALVAAGVVLAILSACSEPGKDARERAEVGEYADPTLNAKPCELLKRSDVEAALGAKVGPGKRASGNAPIAVTGMQHCMYSARKAEFGKVPPSAPVGITSAFPREVFDKYKNAPEKTLIPVPGLGDEAVRSEFAVSHTIVALKGDKVIGVSVSFVENNPAQAAEKLARTALARASPSGGPGAKTGSTG